MGVPKRRPALRGLLLCGVGVVCRVEECAEWVRCSLPSAEGGVEPAASDSEVGCYLLWCCGGPRFWFQGCCFGGPGVVSLGGVGHGGGGIGRGGCGGPPRSSRLRCGVGVGCRGAGVCCPWPRLMSMRDPPRPPRSTLPGGPGVCRPGTRRSWGGWRRGGCGWGCGLLAVVGVEVPAVGAVGDAVRGSQADPVVWVAGQGCLW